MAKNSILLLLCLAGIGSLVGCSGTSAAGGTTPPAPGVAIAFQPAPPSALIIIETATFAAHVSNDLLNLGVDWVLNCSVADCGNLTVAGSTANGKTVHTGSGAAVTYTPPASFPTNTQTVYIAAFSTADDTKNVVSSVSVSGFAGNLKGKYVFELNGTFFDPNTGLYLPYGVAGVLVADGNGNITGGEQTCANSRGTFSDALMSSGSSYAIGPDGRGTIVLNTGDPNVGNQGVENFTVALLSSSQSLLAETDLEAASVGTLDPQSSTAAPSGGYAFAVDGMTVAIDPNSFQPDPVAFGGVFNIDSPGVISGAGSVSDEEVGVTNSDGSTNGVIVNSAPLSGTVSAPDSMGAVTIKMTSSFAPAIQFTGYVVDSTHIKLVESDNSSGAGFGTTAGVAVGQGTGTGSFNNNPAFSGTFVYGVFGQISSTPILGFSSLAGLFTADGAGNLTDGFTDQSNLFGILISDTLTGTYSVDTSGTGRVTATTNFGSNGPGPTLIFYLTGNRNAPLVLDTDVLTLGAGVTYLQAAGPFAFNGPYSFNWNRFSFSVNTWVGATAVLTADGTSGSLSGTEDEGLAGAGAQADQPFSGTFTSGPNGRFTGTFSEGSSTNPIDTGVAIYMIDSTHGLVTQTDGLGFGLGYFGVRPLLCPTCTDARRELQHRRAGKAGRSVHLSRAGRPTAGSL